MNIFAPAAAAAAAESAGVGLAEAAILTDECLHGGSVVWDCAEQKSSLPWFRAIYSPAFLEKETEGVETTGFEAPHASCSD